LKPWNKKEFLKRTYAQRANITARNSINLAAYWTERIESTVMKRPLPVTSCTAGGTPDTTSPLLMGVAEKLSAGNDAKAPTQARLTVATGKSARHVKHSELSATLNAHNAGA
jgi:hypothetical protein